MKFNKDYILSDKFNHIKAHPFHLVDNSPWPILAAFSALYMLFGGVLYVHYFEYGSYLFLSGLLMVTLISILWWRDVLRESTLQGHHTKAVKEGLKLGMILFIVSEAFLFLAFFWAFFHSALAPTIFIGAIWPPVGVQLFNPLGVPLLNTIILLSSGVTITWAHYSIYVPNADYKKKTVLGLFFTIVLGLLFTFFQGVEYLEAPFSINDGIYGSIFYITTGLHGLHVIIGTTFLIVNFVRLLRNHFSFNDHLSFELAIWYWHFVDAIWIFVYLFIYSHCFCWLF